jgi:hypothetical protein
MLAWELARQWQQEHSTVPFEDRVAWHHAHGVVHSDPSCLVLASLVSWDALLKAPASPTAPRNAWFIELAALSGASLSRILQVLPYPMEWIIFRRNNALDLHPYSWPRMAKRVGLHSL